MHRATVLGILAVLVFAWSVLRNIVHAIESEPNEPGWEFVIGTCWPQIYESDPTARMEQLLIDSDQEREMLDAIRKFWQDAESEKTVE